MNHIWPGGLLLAALAAFAAAQPHQPRFESIGQLADPRDGRLPHAVRFTNDAYDRMTVPVRLGSAGPFHFLVDTGADRTAISRELAASLGLQGGSGAVLHSATGQSRVAMAIIPELTVNRRQVRWVRAPLLARSDIGADGILGVDALRSQRLQFDFGDQALALVAAAAPEDDGAIVIRARSRLGRLVITDAEASGIDIDVVLDTGSELSVGNLALRRRLERRGLLGVSGPIELVSVTGTAIRGELATLRHLEMGGVTLQDLRIVFADAHTFGQLGLDRRPALLLGMNGLRSFERVTVDFAERKLRLVVPAANRDRS